MDERGCRGAPDWIVEVLSPATASHDLIVKRRAYERADVREYWLVHPTDRVVTVYIRGDQGFGAPEIYELQGHLTSKVCLRYKSIGQCSRMSGNLTSTASPPSSPAKAH
jgi:Uma2 family endonuclease